MSENSGREDVKRSRINHGKEKISENRGREDVKRNRIGPRNDKKSQSNLLHDKDSSSWCKTEENIMESISIAEKLEKLV